MEGDELEELEEVLLEEDLSLVLIVVAGTLRGWVIIICQRVCQGVVRLVRRAIDI